MKSVNILLTVFNYYAWCGISWSKQLPGKQYSGWLSDNRLPATSKYYIIYPKREDNWSSAQRYCNSYNTSLMSFIEPGETYAILTSLSLDNQATEIWTSGREYCLTSYPWSCSWYWWTRDEYNINSDVNISPDYNYQNWDKQDGWCVQSDYSSENKTWTLKNDRFNNEKIFVCMNKTTTTGTITSTSSSMNAGMNESQMKTSIAATAIGIGVGTAVGGVLLIAFIVLIIFCIKRKKSQRGCKEPVAANKSYVTFQTPNSKMDSAVIDAPIKMSGTADVTYYNVDNQHPAHLADTYTHYKAALAVDTNHAQNLTRGNYGRTTIMFPNTSNSVFTITDNDVYELTPGGDTYELTPGGDTASEDSYSSCSVRNFSDDCILTKKNLDIDKNNEYFTIVEDDVYR